MTRRTIYFVSDGTGITAQTLGHSLLTQFEGVEFNQVTLPFVDTAARAEECLARIAAEAAAGNGRPPSSTGPSDLMATVAAPTAIGVFAGASVGSRASGRIDARILRGLFVVVMVYTAILMAIRALGP